MGEDPSEVRHEVIEAREHLGDTVEALAYKANAPKRAKDEAAVKLGQAKERASAKLEAAKARIDSDPRAARIRDRLQGGTGPDDSIHADHSSARIDQRPVGSPARRPSARDRLEPAFEVVKRHPNATAAAGLAMAAGIVIGRMTGRD